MLGFAIRSTQPTALRFARNDAFLILDSRMAMLAFTPLPRPLSRKGRGEPRSFAASRLRVRPTRRGSLRSPATYALIAPTPTLLPDQNHFGDRFLKGREFSSFAASRE